MRLAHTGNRLAGSKRFYLFLLSTLLIAAGCSPISDIEVSPTPEPRARATFGQIPLAATRTAVARQTPYTIERVTFATNVDPEGAPLEELSVIPASANSIFLSVLVSDLEPRTRFSAFWYEGDQIIDQSETTVTETDGSARWVSLGFQRLADLNPSAPHSVELRINGGEVESYEFRVGTGNLASVIADTTLALGTNGQGQPVSPGTRFDEFAPQFVLVVQLSENVDPSRMIFNALLHRGNTEIDHRTPDGGQPSLPDNPSARDRTITFTFVSDARYVPGKYSVSLMINGTEVRTLPFTIIAGRMPTPTPQPSPSPTVTATSVASGVAIVDARVVTEIDETTGEPESDPLDEQAAPPGEKVTFYVALQLADLRLDDVVEVDVLRNRKHFQRHRFPMAAFDEGWLTVPVELKAPPKNGSEDWYEFLIFVNGTRAERETLSFIQREPTPTPTRTTTPTATSSATQQP